MSTLKILSVFLVFVIFFSMLVISAFSLTNEDQAISAINNSEEAIASTYRAVLGVESAGANVSSLLSTLNIAAELLAKANMSYKTGDFNNATLFANRSLQMVNEVKIETYKTRDLTLNENSQRFIFSLAESAIGVCSVIFFSFVGWRLFKQRYLRHIRKLRPEVSSDES
jgi:hypothetical protein